MPLQRRLPKWGFKNPFRKEYVAINVGTIDYFVQEGKLGKTVTLTDLQNAGLVGKGDLAKLLGEGEINAEIEIEVHKASQSAQEKVNNAGGSVSFIEKTN
jgi:large subunit ribosomal protein L15